MVFVKHLARVSATPRKAAQALVLLVSPFAPNVAEELSRHLGHNDSLAHEGWPTWDERLVVDDVVEVPVQVNGKVRSRRQLAHGDSSDRRHRESARSWSRSAALRENIRAVSRVGRNPDSCAILATV